MRPPSFSWTRWKRTLCCSTAAYRRTGTLTRPKEIEPDQMARGMSGLAPAAGLSKRGPASARRLQRAELALAGDAQAPYLAVGAEHVGAHAHDARRVRVDRDRWLGAHVVHAVDVPLGERER